MPASEAKVSSAVSGLTHSTSTSIDIAASAIDKGKSAPFAWRAAYTNFADQLASLADEVLAGALLTHQGEVINRTVAGLLAASRG